MSLSWRAHANVQRAARIRIHYLSFHQGGCGVDGASSPKAALISTWPGLPQSTSPRYAAAPRGGHHDFFYSCHKERMTFESGALLESHGRGQQTSTCVGENTPTRDIAQEISSRSRKVFADLEITGACLRSKLFRLRLGFDLELRIRRRRPQPGWRRD